MNQASNEHVVDLLPAHINGTLEPLKQRAVREHLRSCAACQDEFLFWRRISEATIEASRQLPAPPWGVLEGALARVRSDDEREPAAARLQLAWQLLTEQTSLVRKEIWSASALTTAVGCLVAALTAGGISMAGTTFAIFAPIVAAVGVAFVYGPDNDPSLEVVLSTPTSPRVILFARLVLVYGYDLMLALGSVVVLAAFHGTFEIWSLISLWIGPMFFLSALALLVSLLFSPMAALSVVLILWGAFLASGTSATPGRGDPAWAQAVQHLWHDADVLLVPLACLLLIAALLYVPRVTGPAREGMA